MGQAFSLVLMLMTLVKIPVSHSGVPGFDIWLRLLTSTSCLMQALKGMVTGFCHPGGRPKASFGVPEFCNCWRLGSKPVDRGSLSIR